jgi:type II secretory pathway pseudopilin PulG
MIRRQTRRAGFTLTEMLVATALTLFIMAIISTAFRAGLDTFSKLRTAGELQSKLRNTTKIMSRDLAMDHFIPRPDHPTAGWAKLYGPKLSDQRMDRLGWMPPDAGYFMLYQPGPSILETTAADGESIGSTKTPMPDPTLYPNVSPVLSFTMKLPSNEYSQQFTTGFGLASPFEFAFNTGSISSPWAQVHYSLVPTPGLDTTEPGPNGEAPLPLYSLRRQMWLLSPKKVGETSYFEVTASQFSQLSDPVLSQNLVGKIRLMEDMTAPPPMTAGNRNLRLVTMQDVINPSVRYSSTTVAPFYTTPLLLSPVHNIPNTATPAFPYTPATLISRPLEDANGDDILLTNVISFQVKAMWEQEQAAVMGPKQIATPLQTLPANPDWPFDDLPVDPIMNGTAGSGPLGTQRWFDTWNPIAGDPTNWDLTPAIGGTPNQIYAQPPLRIRIKALQIKLRIWDEKSKQSRQVTFIQEV